MASARRRAPYLIDLLTPAQDLVSRSWLQAHLAHAEYFRLKSANGRGPRCRLAFVITVKRSGLTSSEADTPGTGDTQMSELRSLSGLENGRESGVIVPTHADISRVLSGLSRGLIGDLAAAGRVQSVLEQCLVQWRFGKRFDPDIMGRCAGRAYARWRQSFTRTLFVPELDGSVVKAVLDSGLKEHFLMGFFHETSSYVDGDKIAEQFVDSLHGLSRWLEGETRNIRGEDAECFRRACEGIQMRTSFFRWIWSLQNGLGCLSPAGAMLRKWCVYKGWQDGWNPVSGLARYAEEERDLRMYGDPEHNDPEPVGSEGAVMLRREQARVQIKDGQPALKEIVENLPWMYAQGVKTLICEDDSQPQVQVVDVESSLHSYLLFLAMTAEAARLAMRGDREKAKWIAFDGGLVLADWCEVFSPGRNAASMGILPIGTFSNDGLLHDAFMDGLARGARGNCKDPEQKEKAVGELTLIVKARMALQAGLEVRIPAGNCKASWQDCRPFGLPVREFMEACARPIVEESLLALLVNANGEAQCVKVDIGPDAVDKTSAIALVGMATRNFATYLSVVHARPGADPRPSMRDRELAGQLKEECERFGICMVPYAVIGNETRMEV